MRRWLVGLLVPALLLAACGGEEPEPETPDAATDAGEQPDEDGSTGEAEADGGDTGEGASNGQAAEPAALNVSYLNVTNAAPLFVGLEQGFFEEEGLDVTPVEAPAASQLPALVSGEVDIAFSNPPASILGRSNELPIKVIAPMAQYSEVPEECILHVMVPEDSDIQEPADLDGRRVAVDTLFQLPHLSVMHAAEAEGADPDSFDYVEIPFPAQIEAAGEGQADAVTLGEPFLTIAEQQGFRRVLPICAGFPEGSAATMWVSSEEFISANEDVIERFERAAIKASEHAAENPDALRQVIPEFTPVSPELADVIVLPVPATTVNREAFQIFYELLEEAGQADAGFDVNELFRD